MTHRRIIGPIPEFASHLFSSFSSFIFRRVLCHEKCAITISAEAVRVPDLAIDILAANGQQLSCCLLRMRCLFVSHALSFLSFSSLSFISAVV